MELWIVIALLVCAVTMSLLALVRQIRFARGLRRLVIHLITRWRNRRV